MKLSQLKEIALRLIKGAELSNLDGLRLKNKTMKLNTRVSDLRRMGFPIEDKWAEGKKRYKKYFIKDVAKAKELYVKLFKQL